MRWVRAPKTSVVYAVGRKVAVGLVGALVVMAGLVMFVTPGPGALVVLLGLGILAVEFAWARRMQHRLHTEVRQAADRVSQRAKGRGRGADAPPSDP